MRKNEPARIFLGAPSPVDQLRALYEADRSSLVRLATALTGDRGIAEEIVQDVFARMLAMDRGRSAANDPGAYLRTAVLNGCRSTIRRRILERRRSRAAAPQPTTGLPTQSDDELRTALLALPNRQRQCVALRFYDDRTVDQIADLLGISSGSVKTHLHRGLAALRTALKEENQ